MKETISTTLSDDSIIKLDKMCKHEVRNRSNMIEKLITDYPSEKLTEIKSNNEKD